MKSIKVKAEEYTTENINNMGYKSQEHFDGFKAGANYVLDEIEKVLQGDLASHSTFKLKCIKQIVEELKK